LKARAVCIAAAAIGLAAAPAANAHPGHVHTGLGASFGMWQQGLLPGSTGLNAPLGASAVAPPAEDPPSDGGSPLRVYVVVVDGLQPQQIGPQTPNLNALKGGGTWYEQARAILPAETLPNHAAMMTGVTPDRNGIVANQFFRGQIAREYMQYPEFWDADTLTTRLERAFNGDIATATILSKEYLYGLFRGEHPGPGDDLPQREADFHWDPRTQPAYVYYPSSHALDAGTMSTFIGWIRALGDSSQRQFAFVNLGDVDRAGHADEGGVATAAIDRATSGQDELSAEHAAPFQQAALTDTDTQVGQLVTELKDTGAWDETVLIVLSDHGMDWGPQNQEAQTTQALTAAGYSYGETGGGRADYQPVGGGGSELFYAYDDRDIEGMARALCAAPGVAVVATRQAVSGLDPTQCRSRSHDELGLDHPYSPDIEVFLEPGWHSNCQSCSANPIPGNHGHGVTQHSALLVTGGHPSVTPAGSIGGPPVYERGNVAAPAGPGVLSVAPTVAALFDIGAPAGGYDAAPLTEAFSPGAVDLDPPPRAKKPKKQRKTTGDGSTEPPPAGTPPALSVGIDVARASLTQATYWLYVANRGGTPAEGVVVTSNVPNSTTFAGASQQPLGEACTAGAAAGTACRWAIGELVPGAARTVEVTLDLTQTNNTYTLVPSVSAQLDGAAPAASDPSDLDSTLKRTTDVLEDAHVDDGSAPDTNFGQCAQLRVADANGVTAFLDYDYIFNSETGSGSGARVDRLWAAELQATLESVASEDATPVDVEAHLITSGDWTEGSGNCAGATGTARDARRPGPEGAEPVSEPAPVSSAAAGAPGERLAWDIGAVVDTRERRSNFNGLELRLGAAETPAEGVTFHSSEAADATRQPRIVTVSTAIETARCIDADPETATRASNDAQRIPAYVTDGLARSGTGDADVCNGMPAPGARVGWEFDADSADAYFASLAGEPTERQVGEQGDVGPNRASTLADPTGRTFVELRLGDPAASGTTKVAAIALRDHDGYFEPPYDTSEGACEPGAAGFLGIVPGCQGGTGESNLEDDILTTWGPAP
jgi:ectonucleotide pyrophosphatase/phosphodiesterase family member 5